MNRLFKRARKHRLLKIGFAIVMLLIAISVFGPLLVNDEGIRPKLVNHLMPPGPGNWFGWGVNGIDVKSWLIYGARTSLIIAIVVTVISMSLGSVIGLCAGFYAGRIDAVTMRIIDIILAFPGILLALYLATIMQPSIFTLIFALSATGWVSYARLVRARVLEIKNREYIIAAQALGASTVRIMGKHIMPNISGPVIIQASYAISVIVLAEASLSFLGLGLPIGTPSWGALLDQGVANLFSSPYLAIYPGLCIAITVLGFNFLGDGLRDILDPKANYDAT
jgi:peptide/nickel transport system permease protein